MSKEDYAHETELTKNKNKNQKKKISIFSIPPKTRTGCVCIPWQSPETRLPAWGWRCNGFWSHYLCVPAAVWLFPPSGCLCACTCLFTHLWVSSTCTFTYTMRMCVCICTCLCQCLHVHKCIDIYPDSSACRYMQIFIDTYPNLFPYPY